MIKFLFLLLFVFSLCYSAEEPISGTRLIVEATGYCPCKKCSEGRHRTFNNTSTDTVPYGLAGDRRHFHIGDKVYIPSGQDVQDIVVPDRLWVIDDRGRALDREATRKIPRIDVRFKDHDWAVRFGRRLIVIVLRSKFAPVTPLPSIPVLANPPLPTSAETLHYLGVSGY